MEVIGNVFEGIKGVTLMNDKKDDDIDLSIWPLKKQEPLPEEFEKILHDNWWDLLD